jgi:DNA-directed RNA polymerase alpha subunit
MLEISEEIGNFIEKLMDTISLVSYAKVKLQREKREFLEQELMAKATELGQLRKQLETFFNDVIKEDILENECLTRRSINTLKRHGIITTADLIELTEKELKNIPSLGEKGREEIVGLLTSKKLSLRTIS